SDLKNEFSKQKSLSESEYFTIIHEKNEEIDNLHEQLLTQNSQIDSHQDTIEHLRKDLHDYEIKYSEQNAQLDQLLDQQKHISESMIRLKNVLNVDANDHDELLEQLLHKMEQSQLIKTESERLNNDLIKQKSEQTNLHNELHHLEQQFDDIKDELHKTQQE
ncbi:unnamed protein product, partial [Adineta steineri]